MIRSFSKTWLIGSWLVAIACLLIVGACSGDDTESAAGAGGTAGDGDGDGDASAGDGDGDGDASAGDGDGDGDASVGTGDAGDGDGDGDGDVEPFVPSGEPIEADDMAWTWIDFPDTQCRDGSMAGIAVSLNSASDKVMIFLQGGGACFDTLTCAGNPAVVGTQKNEQTQGVFSRTTDENPVKDWNYVFVPYCTGDVHLGTKDDGMVTGVAGTQHFVGRLNLEKYLQRIVPTFADASQVLLTGVSAGGFGAQANMEMVQHAFGDIPVTAIGDSAPPMSTEYLPECLQEKWRTTWGFDDSLLKDCGEDCPNPNDYSIPYTEHVARNFPDHLGGLIETTGDGTITFFYGFGGNDCMSVFPTPVPAATFEAGLLDYRAKVMALGEGLGTYFIAGTQHTWISGPAFYTQETGGVKLVDWYRDIVEGTGATHVGP